MAIPVSRALVALLPLVVGGCRSKGEREIPALPAAGSVAFDWEHPEVALSLPADAAASRLGSLEQQARVSWTVQRGAGSRAITAVEQHRVRQLAGGEFEAESALDPGGGPGTETGRSVVWVGGETYARSRWAPWRERPTDRGAAARRFRDESFALAGDIARLAGPALALRAAGDDTLLGRPAKRFTLALRSGERTPVEAPPGRSTDPETAARVELLEGATPLALEGELALDAATGVPLLVRLRGSFGLAADPALRADVDLDSRITALGGAVGGVRAPAGAKADERKPDGPARALEAAGLRERKKPRTLEPAAAPDEESPE